MPSEKIYPEGDNPNILLGGSISARSYIHLRKLLTQVELATRSLAEAKESFNQFLSDYPEAFAEIELIDAISAILKSGQPSHVEISAQIPKSQKSKEEAQTESVTQIVLITPDEGQVSAHSQQKLSPHRLRNVITPYLSAIAQTQYIIDEIRSRKFNEIDIKAITHSSPININLDGAPETVRLITDVVVPWRRKHAKKIAQLLEQEKRAEIAVKKAEIAEQKVRVTKERAEAEKIDSETARLWAETERIKLENDKLRLELHKAKIDMALDFLSRVAPNLSETERLTYLVKLLPSLDIMIFSELEIATTNP